VPGYDFIAISRWLSDAAAQRREADNLRRAFSGNSLYAEECEARARRIEGGDKWGAAREAVESRGGDWPQMATSVAAADLAAST
jgi:hypothetical protein